MYNERLLFVWAYKRLAVDLVTLKLCIAIIVLCLCMMMWWVGERSPWWWSHNQSISS